MDKNPKNIQICCVPTCGLSRSKQVSLFSFPRDIIVRNIWKMLSGITDVSKMFVCSRHFTKSDFKGTKRKKQLKRLRKGAIPSVKLSRDINHRSNDYEGIMSTNSSPLESDTGAAQDEASYVSKESTISENGSASKRKKKRIRKCIVAACDNTENMKTVTLHKFPDNKAKMMVLWRHNLGIDHLKISKNSRVCSDHFQYNDFFKPNPSSKTTRRILKRNAVPTLNPEHTEFISFRSADDLSDKSNYIFNEPQHEMKQELTIKSESSSVVGDEDHRFTEIFIKTEDICTHYHSDECIL